MKKTILFITLLSFAVNIYSQGTTSQAYSKEYYLHKSKNQKTTGWVLLGVGTTMIAIGAIAGGNEFANSSYPFITDAEASSMGTDGVIIVIGAALDVASIPFFISAGKNNRRAYEVALNGENIYWLKNNFVATRPTPAITFRIHF